MSLTTKIKDYIQRKQAQMQKGIQVTRQKHEEKIILIATCIATALFMYLGWHTCFNIMDEIVLIIFGGLLMMIPYLFRYTERVRVDDLEECTDGV